MSITVVGKTKVYASIDDLTEVGAIGDGDRLIIQSEGGTALVDWENVKVDLDHTSFSDRFKTVEDYQSECRDFIEQYTDEFVQCKQDVESLQVSEKSDDERL